MAAVVGGGTHGLRVFRSRAVFIAGLIDVIVGFAILAAGIGVLAWRKDRDGLPIALALGVVALIMLLSGLARMVARLEVSDSLVTWTWSFSTFQVAARDLEDAELVRKGSPASGASWAGFIGGGFLGVLAWWLFDLMDEFIRTEPSLGPLELVVIKHHGGPVSVKPIGAWSTRSSHSEANEALRAVKAVIPVSGHRSPPPLPPAVRYDGWDSVRDD